MRDAVLGLDTSNYRTSLALVTPEGEILLNERRLLPVPSGERGLRQSDAVFAHLRALAGAEDLLRQAGCRIRAVAASVRPRDPEDSYMPVFQVGQTAGRTLAGALGVPFIPTTHQRGHLAAAAFGSALDPAKPYLAVHLSGGTTDLLYLEGEKLIPLGGCLDLHAGQLVDRAGVALGLGFPAGPELETLAEAGTGRGELGCSLEQGDLYCHLSGAESQVQRWIREGRKDPGDIAREIYDLLARTLARMLRAGAKKTGAVQALVTGGVAASALLRRLLTERMRKGPGGPELVFGSPALSGDNAVGVALIGIRSMAEGDGA